MCNSHSVQSVACIQLAAQSTVHVSSRCSCILLNFFHPWMAAECRGGRVNEASSSMWRVEVVCPLKRDQQPMMLFPTNAVAFIARYYVWSLAWTTQRVQLWMDQSTRLRVIPQYFDPPHPNKKCYSQYTLLIFSCRHYFKGSESRNQFFVPSKLRQQHEVKLMV